MSALEKISSGLPSRALAEYKKALPSLSEVTPTKATRSLLGDQFGNAYKRRTGAWRSSFASFVSITFDSPLRSITYTLPSGPSMARRSTAPAVGTAKLAVSEGRFAPNPKTNATAQSVSGMVRQVNNAQPPSRRFSFSITNSLLYQPHISFPSVRPYGFR